MTEYPQPYTDPVLTVAHSPAGATSPPASQSDDPSAKDKAAQSAQAGKQAATEVAQTATDKAKDVAAETKAQARNLVGEAQSQLKDQASTQHRSAVTNLRQLGDQLHSMASSGDQSGVAGHLVEQAGDRAHTVASWLDQREPADLINEVRIFARRRPGAFLAGALIAGVVAGRLTRGAVAVHHDDSDTTNTQITGAYGSGAYQPVESYSTAEPYSAVEPYGAVESYTTGDPAVEGATTPPSFDGITR